MRKTEEKKSWKRWWEARSFEETLTLILWGVALFLIVAAAIVCAVPVLRREFTATCIMRTALGLYCPGCGGTRALVYLLQGRFLTSLFYHPFVLYAVAGVGSFMLTNTLAMLTKGKVRGLPYKQWYVYGGLALIAGNFIWKNAALLMGTQLIP